MKGAEVGIAVAPQDPKRGCDGAPARRQHEPGEEDECGRPGRPGEQIGEAAETGDEAIRQRRAGIFGTTTGMLHPEDGIGAAAHHNLPPIRHIDQSAAPRLASRPPLGHTARHDQNLSDPDPDRGAVPGTSRRAGPAI